MGMNRRRLILTAAGAGPAGSRRGASVVGAAILGVALALAGTAVAQAKADRLNIYAAASLTEAFTAYDSSQKYNFVGSNTLETQIRQGAPADVFASASPANTQRLYGAGLVDRPVTFTANRLALIVPKSNPAGITSVYDLRTKDVKLVIAGAAVPVGGYTRTVLGRMGLSAVLSKVVSQESDVKAVTGKVALGQADAGFVYVTDARAVSDQVRVIRIPAWAQPRVRYEIAVVSRSGNKAAARAWIKGILSPKGQAALRNAGFLPITKVSS
jgi:molybdate transport system substrate-binding protein